MRSRSNGSSSLGAALAVADVVASSCVGPSHGAASGFGRSSAMTVTANRPLLCRVNAVSNVRRCATGKKTFFPPDPETG